MPQANNRQRIKTYRYINSEQRYIVKETTARGIVRRKQEAYKDEMVILQKKISQLPAVDMQHAPAKLPSKLHLSAYVDFWYSHCAACTVAVHQSLV